MESNVQSRLGVTTLRYQNRKYQFPSIIVRSGGRAQCIMLDVCLLCPFCSGDIHARVIPLESRMILAEGRTRHSYPPAGPDVSVQCEDLGTSFARQFPHLVSPSQREHLQHCNVANRLSLSADARLVTDQEDSSQQESDTEVEKPQAVSISMKTKSKNRLTDRQDDRSSDSDSERAKPHPVSRDSLSHDSATEGDSTQTSDTDSVDSVRYVGDTVKRAFPHDVIRHVLYENSAESESADAVAAQTTPTTILRSPKSPSPGVKSEKKSTEMKDEAPQPKRKTAVVVKTQIHQTIAEVLDLPFESDSDEDEDDAKDVKKTENVEGLRSVSQLSDYGSMDSVRNSRENMDSRLDRSRSEGMGSMDSSFSSAKKQDMADSTEIPVKTFHKDLPESVTQEFVKLREKMRKDKPAGAWSYDDLRQLYKNVPPGSSPFRHSAGDRIASVYPVFDFRRGAPGWQSDSPGGQRPPDIMQGQRSEVTQDQRYVQLQTTNAQHSPPSSTHQHSPSRGVNQNRELDINANVAELGARQAAAEEEGIADAEREMERVVGEMTSLEAELEQMYRMTARSMNRSPNGANNGAANLGDSSTTLASLQERQRIEQEEIERLQELEEERRRPFVPDETTDGKHEKPHRRKEGHGNVPKEEARFEEEERRVQLWLREQQKRQKLLQKQNLTQQERRRLQLLNEQRRQQFLQERVRMQLESRSHGDADENIPSAMSQEDVKRRQKIKEKLQKQTEQLQAMQVQALYRQQNRLQASAQQSEEEAERQWQAIQLHQRHVLQQQMEIANQQAMAEMSNIDEHPSPKQKPPVPPKPQFSPPRVSDLTKAEETPPEVRRMRNVMFFLGAGASNEEIAQQKPQNEPDPSTASNETESFKNEHLYEERALASLENANLNYYDEDGLVDWTGDETQEAEGLIQNPNDIYSEQIQAKDISQMIDILERVVEGDKSKDDDEKSTSSSEDEQIIDKDPEETVDEILENIDADSYSPNATLSRAFTIPHKKYRPRMQDVPEQVLESMLAEPVQADESHESMFDKVLERIEDELKTNEMHDSGIKMEEQRTEQLVTEPGVSPDLGESPEPGAGLRNMAFMSRLEEKRSSSTECLPDDNTSLEMERSISYSENTSETASYDEDSVDLQMAEGRMSQESSEAINHMVDHTRSMTQEILQDPHQEYLDVRMRMLSPIREEKSNRSSAVSNRSSDRISYASYQSSEAKSSDRLSAVSSRSSELMESPRESKADETERLQHELKQKSPSPGVQQSISKTVAEYMDVCDESVMDQYSRSTSHSPRDNVMLTSSESESGSLRQQRDQLSPYAYEYGDASEMEQPVHIRLYPSAEDISMRYSNLPPEQVNQQLTIITDTLQIDNGFHEGKPAISPRSPQIMSPKGDEVYEENIIYTTESDNAITDFQEAVSVVPSRSPIIMSPEREMVVIEISTESEKDDDATEKSATDTTEKDTSDTTEAPQISCITIEQQNLEVTEITTEVQRRSVTPALDQTEVVYAARYEDSDSDDFSISSEEDEITNVIELIQRVKKEYNVPQKYEGPLVDENAEPEPKAAQDTPKSESDSGSEVVIDETEAGEVYKVKLDRQSSLHYQMSLKETTPSDEEDQLEKDGQTTVISSEESPRTEDRESPAKLPAGSPVSEPPPTGVKDTSLEVTVESVTEERKSLSPSASEESVKVAFDKKSESPEKERKSRSPEVMALEPTVVIEEKLDEERRSTSPVAQDEKSSSPVKEESVSPPKGINECEEKLDKVILTETAEEAYDITDISEEYASNMEVEVDDIDHMTLNQHLEVRTLTPDRTATAQGERALTPWDETTLREKEAIHRLDALIQVICAKSLFICLGCGHSFSFA